MVNRARLWSDDSCENEHVYTCSKEVDMQELMMLSIDRSTCYLERHVFSLQEKDHPYGQTAIRFMQTKHKLCTTERYLHKQVKHWRDRGLAHIRWHAFLETCGSKLPSLVMKEIKLCMFGHE